MNMTSSCSLFQAIASSALNISFAGASQAKIIVSNLLNTRNSLVMLVMSMPCLKTIVITTSGPSLDTLRTISHHPRRTYTLDANLAAVPHPASVCGGNSDDLPSLSRNTTCSRSPREQGKPSCHFPTSAQSLPNLCVCGTNLYYGSMRMSHKALQVAMLGTPCHMRLTEKTPGMCAMTGPLMAASGPTSLQHRSI